MAGEIKRIPFEEFSSNLRAFFELVISKRKAFMVETEPGEVVEVKLASPSSATPTGTSNRKRKEADREAFLSSAGGWKGLVDTDKLVEGIYESRHRVPSRPPIRL